MNERKMFTVIVPTLGRDSLPKTLDSIDKALCEIIIVADGFELSHETYMYLRKEAELYEARFYIVDIGRHDFGSPQLQFGYKMATGKWILNCGDDDIYFPWTFKMLKEIIDKSPAIPMVFRTILHPGSQRGNKHDVILWEDPEIRNKNITGQCLVVPNVQEKLGNWNILADHMFIWTTIMLGWNKQVMWRKEIISECF